MPGRKHLSRPAPRGDWIHRDQPLRNRPWALAQQLFGTVSAQVEPDRCTHAELERQLRDQARRIAELESKVAVLQPQEREAQPGEPPGPRRTVTLRRRNDSGPEFWLAHCEGFLVDSPTGPVGVVESVLFGSRLDVPDELEIRVGRLRAVQFVVPIGEIEGVDPEEHRIRLTCDPRVARRHDRSQALLPRARRRFDSFVSTTFR
jgi:hypothetical protein